MKTKDKKENVWQKIQSTLGNAGGNLVDWWYSNRESMLTGGAWIIALLFSLFWGLFLAWLLQWIVEGIAGHSMGQYKYYVGVVILYHLLKFGTKATKNM